MLAMQRFYENFGSIDVFTLSLDGHQDKLECAHCLKNDQFVSHGVVYKQRSIDKAEKVGKRIFCSNRYGRNGCGRTFQLYVASEIPFCRYGAAQLLVFIISLLANLTIADSYQQATGQLESTHAWRWLNKLMAKLSDYRHFLKVRAQTPSIRVSSRSKPLQHLLPTLVRLFTDRNNGCVVYQTVQQQPFF